MNKGSLLFESGDHLSLLNLVNKFPGYANFALGKNYSIDFKDFHKGQVRKAETEKSISYLKNAKEKDIGSYFKKETFLTLADVFKRSNNFVAAKETLDEFIQTFSYDPRHSGSITKAKSILNDLS